MGASQIIEQPQVPGVGMRGGLGRTLLTAFLFMAIVPLGFISWYATANSRLNIQEEVIGKLGSIAALKETQILRWVEREAMVLSNLGFLEQVEIALLETEAYPHQARERLAEVARDWGVVDLALLGLDGRVEWASDMAWEGDVMSLPSGQEVVASVAQAPLASHDHTGLALVGALTTNDRWPYIAVYVSSEGLTTILEETVGLGETGEAYLVDQTGRAFPQGERLSGASVQTAIQGQESQGIYENNEGELVIGVQRWFSDLDLALVVEQAQEEALARNDDLAAAVIAWTLGVALITAVIAAFLAGQITRSVVRLSESALHIAAGDLSQRVEVTSRNEIGILAHVFNRMASELEVLYNDLEAKVVERTAMLQEANYQIQRRAIQMQASLEVGQAITSILDPDRLLEQVVHVVRDRFVYSYVAVYTVAQEEGQLLLRAFAGEANPSHGEQIPANFSGPVGWAFRQGEAKVESRPVVMKVGPPVSYIRSEIALPLRLGDRTLGILDVQSTDEKDLDQDDVSVLQNVANQITVALENARAYAFEREAVERLRELDQSKRRFLTNMSHELRTPLTNIIGFSRLILKEIDGPITEQQQSDLQIIFHNGQHLLGLINDLLDVSQIEAGLMELEFRKVDLSDLIRSVMATASALVRGSVALREDIQVDLPEVRADPARVRQVLLRLLTNASKFTEQGTITVTAHSTDGQVLVSVSDTGVGIPEEDQERIFEQFEQGVLGNGRRPNGAGLGLALSKEFIEMHGGEIWVESTVGEGSTFTFSIPLVPPSVSEFGA